MLTGSAQQVESQIKGWDWLASECERVLADIRAERESKQFPETGC